MLGGDGEDVVGGGEEHPADVARGGGALGEVVVADEQEGGLGVVGGVADDLFELGGDVDAAVWHEVVDVVDDDEGGPNLLDVALDLACELPEVFPVRAEQVEADEGEAAVLPGDVCIHLSTE